MRSLTLSRPQSLNPPPPTLLLSPLPRQSRYISPTCAQGVGVSVPLCMFTVRPTARPHGDRPSKSGSLMPMRCEARRSEFETKGQNVSPSSTNRSSAMLIKRPSEATVLRKKDTNLSILPLSFLPSHFITKRCGDLSLFPTGGHALLTKHGISSQQR